LRFTSHIPPCLLAHLPTHSSFSLTARPPPCPPLFPYTTLFRSVAGKTGTSSNYWNRWFCGTTPYYTAAVWTGYDMPEQMYFYGKDRKSTRLNSSHVSISYAVFCLKKKSSRSDESTSNKAYNT